MYSRVRVLDPGGQLVSDLPGAARARVEVLEQCAGFVTLLAVRGDDDDALVIVEIFETLDDMAAAGRDARRSSTAGGLEGGRTIAGEIVFQRGL